MIIIFGNVNKSVAATGTPSSGYFAGGFSTGSVVTVLNNLTFSSNTNSVTSASLSSARAELAGVYSSVSGYFGGGSTGSYSNTIDNLAFSTVTCGSMAAVLSLARYSPAGIQSLTNGYFGGGATGSAQSVIDTLAFSSNTCSSSSATLSSTRYAAVGVSSTSVGYFGGSGSAVSTIDAFNYTTNTCSALSATLSGGRFVAGGTNSATNGYFGGGFNGSSNVSTIDNLTFSSSTCSALSATLSQSRQAAAGVNSLTNGYFGGGSTGSDVSTIDNLTFSSSTCSALSATLSSVRSYLAGASYIPKSTQTTYSAGYYGGGQASGGTNNMGGLSFSTQAYISVSATLQIPSPQYTNAAVGSITKGYWGGGYPNSSTISGFNFNTRLSAAISSSLTQNTSDQCGTNGAVRGYFNAGYAYSSITYLIYDTEVTGNSTASLPTQWRDMAGVQSLNYSYCLGGADNGSAGGHTTVQGFSFCNEAALTFSATLPSLSQYASGMSGPNTGYTYGAYNATSTTINTIAFATNTTGTNSSAAIVGRSYPACIQNSSNGYALSGNDASIETLTFSTSVNALISATLPTITYAFAGASPNLNYNAHRGYLSGATTSSTSIYGLDFVAAKVWTLGAVLSSASFANGTSSLTGPTLGYFATGTSVVLINGLVFANETIAVVSSSLSTTYVYYAGVYSRRF